MSALAAHTLVLAATPRRLSEAYGGQTTVDARTDIAYKQLILQSEAADCYIGGAAVTTSSYGYKLLTLGSNPLVLGPFDAGPIKLSSIYAVGAGATLHILGIPL